MSILSRFSNAVPVLIEKAFSRVKSGPLSNDREAFAREWWPEDLFPTLYREIPEDIHRPVVWDGRVLGGQPVTWLAWRHLNNDVIAKAVQAGFWAALYASIFLFIACLLGAFFFGNIMVDAGFPYPDWADEIGMTGPILGWHVAGWFNWLSVHAGVIGYTALSLIFLFPAFWFFGFWRSLKNWWNETAEPLRVPTRDALLMWKARADIRNAEYHAYCRQVEEATGRLADVPIIPLGTAEGVLHARGDMESPVPGQIVAFDGESIRQHTLALGGTGSGKTRLVIRPLFDQIMEADWGEGHKIGAYVTDGKGTLWRDLLPVVADRDDVRIIGTGDDHYGVNLLQGMTPLEVATVFKAVSGQVAGKVAEDFWPEQASLLLMHAAAIARIIEEQDEGEDETWTDIRPYSLLGLAKIAADETIQAAACERLFEIAEAAEAAGQEISVELDEALNSAVWLTGTWLPMAQETKSSIIANVNVVLGKLGGAAPLAERFFSGRGGRFMDVDHALTGGIVFIAVGETEWGMAGKVVNCWLKSRLFIAARRRLVSDPEGCRTHSCAMFVDEFQMLVTGGPDSDTSFWNIARETGVFLIAATQSLAALRQVLGHDQTDNLVNLLRSKIVLKTEETSTIDYIRKIAGEKPRGWEVENLFFATQGARELMIPDNSAADPKPGFWHFMPTLPTLPTHTMKQVFSFNPAHVIRGTLQDKSQQASTTLSEQLRVEDKNDRVVVDGVQWRPKIETDELLLGSGFAFAIIQRAGGDRSDIIDLAAWK